jgi:phage protein D
MSATMRQPRLLVLADGVAVPGATSAQVVATAHATADRFRVTLAATPVILADWADTDSALIDVQFSLDGLFWQSLIQGNIDQIRLDPISGQVLLEGRDLSANLIDTRLAASYPNQTSSDLATQFATQAGLTANVAPTTTMVGAYWQLEHDQVALAAHCRARSQWDLLLQLAAREQFDLWVSGTVLNFQPSGQTVAVPSILSPSDCLRLSLERSLTLARDISVTVKSWNSRQGSAVSQTARANRSAGAASGAAPLSYTYLVPNLTADAAQSLAERRLSELTLHEKVIEAEMPGELELSPRQQILMAGTGTSFDQTYWIDSITRRLSVQQGFTQSLRARNASPDLSIVGE